MTMFPESLKEYAVKIINFKKKKNEVIDKQTAEIISKLENLIYLYIFVSSNLPN